VVDQYLARYATPEAGLAGTFRGTYGYAVVVPAYDERVELLDGLTEAAATAAGRVLCIVVVNATDAATPSIHAANEGLLDDLQGRSLATTSLGTTPPAWLCALTELDVLVIDRATLGNRLPDRQGVGLARRIGCDVALALRARGRLSSPWIHTTDADVRLPADYFTASDGLQGAALTYPFWHRTDDSPDGRALALYELSLRYYVAGLHWAGSSYAFHTVGSTIAVDHRAYAGVRGVPLREAGEDFYLLNKVAKLGAVMRPASQPITIRQRHSDRVPFGTGPATRRIAADRAEGRPFRLYSPAGFELLRQWLSALDRFAGTGELELTHEVEGVVQALGARDAVLAAADATTSPEALRRRVRDWFDGFRTLKLIHAARDGDHPKRPWREALSQAPFLEGVGCFRSPDSTVDDMRRALLASTVSGPAPPGVER
jgi:hypothetical protein